MTYHNAAGRTFITVASIVISIVGWIVVQPTPVRAQQPPAAAPLTAPDAPGAVYVRDSIAAVEGIALAERLSVAGDWSGAARAYQDVSERFAAFLVPSRTDSAGRVDQYESVTSAVRRRLTTWPAEGRAAIETLFGPAATQALASVESDNVAAWRATLREVVDRFEFTAAGLDAAERLAADAYARGDFAASVDGFDRLLEAAQNVAPTDALAVLRFRAALASHLAGRTADAARHADRVRTVHADASATILGEPTRLSDALDAALSVPPPRESVTAEPTDPDVTRPADWPMAFGGVGRSGVVPDGLVESPQAFSPIYALALADPPVSSEDGAPRFTRPDLARNQADTETELRARGHRTGILPSVRDGQLFYQDNTRVYAVDLESGLPLPGWAETHAATGGAFPSNAPRTPNGRPLGLAVGDEVVLSILGQTASGESVIRGFGGRLASSDHQFVCLDRRDGTLRWSLRPGRIAWGEADTNLARSRFVGTPLLVGDRVYVLLRGETTPPFEETSLACFDVADGRLVWTSHLGGGHRRLGGFGEPIPASSDGAGHPAYADGRVFVSTNLGTIAAIDAITGRTIWLTLYPTPQPPARDARVRLQVNAPGTRRGGLPYKTNPPIVRDGRLFVLPDDADSVFIYDTRDGSLVQRVRRGPMDDADLLLHADAERLVLADDRRVYVVNWPAADPDVPVERYLFGRSTPLLGPQTAKADEAQPIRGRPFVTDGSILVPTTTGLRLLDSQQARAASREIDWRDGPAAGGLIGAGNVLSVGTHLIVAGPTGVAVYTDPSTLLPRLESAVASNPDAVQPRLRLAAATFTLGHRAAAVRLLEEIDASPVSPDAPPPKQGRTDEQTPAQAGGDVFRLAMTLAGRVESSDKTVADALLRRASQVATTPPQQVEWRFAVAERLTDGAEAVSLLQEVLGDRASRRVALDGGTAGAVAEARIASRIRTHGPSVYTEPARRAEALLAAADAASRTTGRPGAEAATLLEIADAYPNAPAAGDALRRLASLHESDGAYRDAAATLRRLYARLPSAAVRRDSLADERHRLLEDLTRVYLRMPGREAVASARLARLADARPDGRPHTRLLMPDGTPLPGETFAHAAEALRTRLDSAASARLPRLDVVLSPPPRGVRTYDLVDPDAARPLDAGPVADRLPAKPGRTRRDEVDANYVLASASDGTRRMFVPETGHELWQTTELFPGDAAQSAAEAGYGHVAADGTYILWGGGSVMSVETETGRQRWRFDASPADDAPADVSPAVRGVHAGHERVTFALTDGRVVGLDAATGSVVWTRRAGGDAPLRLRASEDFVVAFHTDRGVSRVAAFDAIDGTPLLDRTFDNELITTTPLLSDDGMLVWTHPNRLVGYDLFAPSARGPAFTREFGGRAGNAFGHQYVPRQLTLAGDQILAITDAGTPSARVRAFALRDGRPILVASPDLPTPVEAEYNPIPLSDAGVGDRVLPALSLMSLGTRFYVLGVDSVAGYDVARPGEFWFSPPGFADGVQVTRWHATADALVGIASVPEGKGLRETDPFVDDGGIAPGVGDNVNDGVHESPMGDQPLVGPQTPHDSVLPVPGLVAGAGDAVVNAVPTHTVRLFAFSRSLTQDGVESGLLFRVQDLPIAGATPEVAMAGVRPVDGGIVARSAEGTRYFPAVARRATSDAADTDPR